MLVRIAIIGLLVITAVIGVAGRQPSSANSSSLPTGPVVIMDQLALVVCLLLQWFTVEMFP